MLSFRFVYMFWFLGFLEGLVVVFLFIFVSIVVLVYRVGVGVSFGYLV